MTNFHTTDDGNNITISVHGLHAVAELTKLSPTFLKEYPQLPQGNWLYFSRLINQSHQHGLGTVLLDEVLRYCQFKSYSIFNDVNAYGKMSQSDLEKLYISKGFVPVNISKYRNNVLYWIPKKE